MKVTMITTSSKIRCGIATYSHYLGRELAKLVDLDIVVIENPVSLNPFYFFKLARTARKNADIVHVQEASIFGPYGIFNSLIYLGLLSRNRTIIVSTIHEMVSRGDKKLLTMLFGKVYEKCTHFLELRCSDTIIVHTQTAKKFLEKRKKKNLIVIPHGSYQNPVFMDSQKSKEKLGLNGKKILTIFGFVGRNKGYERIIEILPYLDDEVILLIAGGPRTEAFTSYFKELKQIERHNSRVKVTDYINEEDIPLIFNASDILLIPYTNASQSGPLSIALAYKKPVVTSDLLPFREIKEEYDCIEIARGREEFLQKIKELLESAERRESLVKNIKRYYEETSWKIIAEKHFELYKKSV